MFDLSTFPLIDLENDDIAADLNLLLINVPKNVSPLEQIRWLYIKAGHLFCYDYRISGNPDIVNRPLDFENNTISRFQTCTQISYILKLMIEFLDPNIKVNIIARKGLVERLDGIDHVANEVILPTGEKLLLDLTIDLYLIQSGCRTKQFAFTTDASGSYDIISLREAEDMDRRLGLIPGGEYTDDRILRMKDWLHRQHDFDTNEEKYLYYITQISSFNMHFHSSYEGKLFVSKLFTELMDVPFREFNLTHAKGSEGQIVTCFCLYPSDEEEMWVLYNHKTGIVPTNKANILYMMNTGWVTNSNTLNNLKNSSRPGLS